MKYAQPFLLSLVLAVIGTAAPAADDEASGYGRRLFEQNWTAIDGADAPALFNERSCAACHIGAGPARATFLEQYAVSRGLVVRFADRDGLPDPHYGSHMQIRSGQDRKPEGRLVLEKGEGSLRWRAELFGPPVAEGITVALRQAPALFGRGAIAAIPDAAILAHADPGDLDRDGISGRARMLTRDGREVPGRFGWKAGVVTLDEQVVTAFDEEIGQPALAGAEIAAISAYVATLPVMRETFDETGLALFSSTGCAACHIPDIAGGDPRTGVFSDLLLHDMGVGLDDGLVEQGTLSAEWRTAPLVALAAAGGRRYLHDGRAPDIDRAIRAHGGEAETSRSAYAGLPEEDRHKLVSFLEGL